MSMRYSETTTRTTGSSLDDGALLRRIPKVTVIKHGATQSRDLETQIHSVGAISAKELNNILLELSSLETSRRGEYKNLRDCNEKLASYMERCRFFELQNKRLAKEIDELKANMGKETVRMKKIYETEVASVERLLSQSAREIEELKVREGKFAQDCDTEQRNLEIAKKEALDEKTRAEKDIARLLDMECEVLRLRFDIQQSQEEREELKSENDVLRERMRTLRADLNQEELNHLNAKNAAYAYNEELIYFKSICDQERKELAKLADRNTTHEAYAIWASEINPLLKELHEKFDNQAELIRNEVESKSKLKVNEIRMNRTKENVEVLVLTKDKERLIKINVDLKSRLATLTSRWNFLQDQYRMLVEQDQRYSAEYAATLTKLREDKRRAEEEVRRLGEEIKRILDAKITLQAEINRYKQLLEQELLELEKRSQERARFAAGGSSETVVESRSGGGYSSSSSYSASAGGASGYSSSYSAAPAVVERRTETSYSSSTPVVERRTETSYSSSSSTPVVERRTETSYSSSTAGAVGGGDAYSESYRSSGYGGGDGSESGASMTTTTTTRRVVESSSSSGGGVGGAVVRESSSSSMQSGGVEGEVSAQRTQVRQLKIATTKHVHKGFIEVSMLTPDGKCLTLAHTGRSGDAVVLDGWNVMVSQQFADSPRKIFKVGIPSITLQPNEPGKTLKIWSRGTKPANAGESDIEMNEVSWGTLVRNMAPPGVEPCQVLKLELYNEMSEVMATFGRAAASE